MIRQLTVLFFCSLFIPGIAIAQEDTTLANLQEIPANYITSINQKFTKYSRRVNDKTTKTLQKLVKWESKIQQLLQKADPATAHRLFANPELTFAGMLQKYEQAASTAESYTAKYDEYRDKLTTQFNYLETQQDLLPESQVKQLAAARNNLQQLNRDADKAEALQKMIQERKKELIKSAVAHIGKSKYLQKINKESFYYAETLRNYKEIFNDKKKAEETALKLLNSIPEFREFAKSNSSLSGIFGMSPGYGGLPNTVGNIPVVSGIPSRVSLQQFTQPGVVSNASNVFTLVQSKITGAGAGLDMLNQALDDQLGLAKDILPDFKPNSQKAKTFNERLEPGFDIQFNKSNSYFPTIAKLGVQIGYKLNDKLTMGLGANYVLGLGNSIEKIRFSNEGLGLRTFAKWKVFKSIKIQGNGEWNYLTGFKRIADLRDMKAWQMSALVGLNKSLGRGKKAKADIQLLLDLLYNTQQPLKSPFILRYGYSF